MANVYSFFLDIDGTIFGGQPISPAVTDAICRARAAGHKVFINTSRAYIGLPAEVYDMPFDGFVTSFGLEILAEGTWLHRYYLPRDVVRDVAAYAFEHAVPTYFEGDIRLDIHRDGNPATQLNNLCELDAAMGDKNVSKFVLRAPLTEEERARFAADYDFFGGECIAKGHNKAYGITVLEKHYGLSHEHTVAIGDTFLDADMIAYAGIGICMGNGTPDTKAIAPYVTKSLAEDGVAFAIDCVLSGNLDALKK